ncbi:hypothetical protein [Hafnia phage Pocis76]|uniref:Uncharacterized protein n=1 Tax=Hafnia phage Pocis76 TaxID=2831174 RepID=A0A8E7FN57_9CAUD|nr:hypothetical protein [Hafnia phage Pocis76]
MLLVELSKSGGMMFLITTESSCIYTAGVESKAEWHGDELIITTYDANNKELRKVNLSVEEAATLTMEKR